MAILHIKRGIFLQSTTLLARMAFRRLRFSNPTQGGIEYEKRNYSPNINDSRYFNILCAIQRINLAA